MPRRDPPLFFLYGSREFSAEDLALVIGMAQRFGTYSARPGQSSGNFTRPGRAGAWWFSAGCTQCGVVYAPRSARTPARKASNVGRNSSGTCWRRDGLKWIGSTECGGGDVQVGRSQSA